MASDDSWVQSTECDKELAALEAFHGFGSNEFPVGRVGRTGEGSVADPEDLGRTRMEEENDGMEP